jgi:hypothetical protein
MASHFLFQLLHWRNNFLLKLLFLLVVPLIMGLMFVEAENSLPTRSVESPSLVEVSRFNDLSNAVSSGFTSVVKLTQDIESGQTAVILMGWEATAGTAISSVTDSRGHAWKIQSSQLISTVHQQAFLSAYISDGLFANDTITLTWTVSRPAFTSAPGMSGTLLSLTGGDASNTPHLLIKGNSYGTSVNLPGTTTLANTLLVGILQTEQNKIYSNSNWTQLGEADKLGQSQHTVGLANIYLYAWAQDTGTYNPGGNYSPISSYDGIWAAFPINGTFTPAQVDGVCSPNLNQCSAGSLVDVPDSATYYLWSCSGTNGGATSSCSLAVALSTAGTALASFTNGFDFTKSQSITIPFNLVGAETVSLIIYDRQGYTVKTLLNESRPSGTYSDVTWDGRNESGTVVASGVYILQFKAGSVTQTKKIVAVK